MARLPPRRPVVDALGRHDLDPEAREPDIGEPGRGQQADRGDAQILENLGAKPDLAPLPRARDLGAGRARLRDGMRGHTRRPVAQKDDDAATFLLEALQRGVDRSSAAKYVADDVGAMQPRQYVLAVTDAAVDEGHVLDRIERCHVGVACECSDLALHRKFADALDQLVARLPVGNEIGDRDLLSLWRSAKAVTPGPRITVPSSFISSARTPIAGSPARRHRSTQSSVCPERISTPPSLATSGKTCPGRTKSLAPILPLASARTVLVRSSAEIPVINP